MMLNFKSKNILATIVLVITASSGFSAPPPERNWNMVWNDEFNSLDLSKWVVQPDMPRGNAWWYANNVYAENGNLVIRGMEQDGKYTSGAVWGKRGWEDYTFIKKFGYFEARIKLQNEPGLWSTFWMMPKDIHNVDDSGRDGCEIDILEKPDKTGNIVQHNLHFDGYNGTNHQYVGSSVVVPGIDDGEFHTYGLWWTTDKYSFYVDGVKTWETSDPKLISQVEEYLYLSVEPGPWAGDITTADLPCYTYYDYVRVYDDMGDNGNDPAPSFSLGAELLTNGDAESGTTGWTCLSPFTTSPTNYSGTSSFHVTGRTENWHAVEQDVYSQMLAEGSGTYEVTAFLKDTRGVPKKEALITVQISDDAGDYRSISKQAKIKIDTEWTKVTGFIALNFENLKDAKIVVRPFDGTADYYVDDISLKKVAIPSDYVPPPDNSHTNNFGSGATTNVVILHADSFESGLGNWTTVDADVAAATVSSPADAVTDGSVALELSHVQLSTQVNFLNLTDVNDSAWWAAMKHPDAVMMSADFFVSSLISPANNSKVGMLLTTSEGTIFEEYFLVQGADNKVTVNLDFSSLGLSNAAWGNVSLFFNGAPVTEITNRSPVYVDNFRVTEMPEIWTAYETWYNAFQLEGTNAAVAANPDGDYLNNLYEYALGGNPTNAADQGISPVYEIVENAGTNWFMYTHPVRALSDSGLNYYLETTTNLAAGAWTNCGYETVGFSAPVGGFSYCTNRISTEEFGTMFIRLIVAELEP